MRRKTARANNAFLLGSLILIVLVLVVVVLFLFLSFKIYDKKQYTERYEIVLGASTLNTPLSVYLNDSLLFEGTPQSTLTLSVARFAQESSLLIVDETTQNVSTIELPEHSETIKITKNKDGYFKKE